MTPLDLSTDNLANPLIQGINDVLPNLPKALVLLLFGFVLIKIVSWVAQLLLQLVRLPKGLKGILVSLMDALLWVFLIISLLQALGLTNVALAFSGSIVALGLALGTGAASLAADILAGIFLAQDKDFNIGDEVKAGEGGTEGVIQSMDMRRTRILAKDGKLHIMPNSVIERKEWVVLAKKRDRV
ncbi:MAG TPA: mechanosensitive ion channel domain-containing protein [Candidatus Saccharimonadales bacterium]|nr:mechanosensitive ion channel domain-containing protein [Candidatus Saccharimonadales bacterium]